MDCLKEKTPILLSLAVQSVLAFFVIIVLTHFLIPTAQAAPLKGYQAMPMSITGSGQLLMQPGERKQVHVSWQNNGNKDWLNDGPGYVSVYTYDPKYRKSDFDPGTWLGPEQVSRIIEAVVPIGQVGTVSFELHAPAEEGVYTESFHLASESTAWIPGGDFKFTIQVQEKTTELVIQKSEDQDEEPVFYSGYHAELASILDTIKVQPKGTVEAMVQIVNNGNQPWKKRQVQLPDIMMASTSPDYFHSSWLTRSILVARSSDLIEPGDIEELPIRFTAPDTAGEHVIRFQLVADGTTVSGGEIDIPITVTTDAPDVIDQPIINVVDPIEEPVIRVGVLTVDEETNNIVQINSQSKMMLRDEIGNPLANVPVGITVSAYYKDNYYYYDAGRGLEKSTYPLRFIPETENAILTVANFDRRVTRNAGFADNTFRNILELRQSDVKDNVWLINELPMETYLAGLAETSNISHIEFQKTLIVAARTYAFYHWQRGTKHDAEGFHVDAYADQVYKGAGQEARMPKLTEAIEDTRGVIVTYDGETAITPYFSRSDGRTRDWSEVWYGNVDWLKSVSVPQDIGKTLWGHGVGMSASGALGMANDGQTFDQILKYFYTGVDLTQQWK